MAATQSADPCPHCSDGFLIIETRIPFSLMDDESFAKFKPDEQKKLVETYGGRDRVPNYKPGSKTSMAYACLCPRGVLRTGVARSAADVLDEREIRAMWPNGVPVSTYAKRDTLTRAGIPERMLAWSIDTYRQRFPDADAKRLVKWGAEWIKSDERTDVLMFGTNGTGKTGLAVALVRGAIERKQTALFRSVPELMLRWRSLFHQAQDAEMNREDESDLFTELTTPVVLVLDEIGGSKVSEFVEDTITLVVDKRQKAGLVTILTCNLPHGTKPADAGETLTELIGPTLFDRLREQAQFWPMFGDSKRKTLVIGKPKAPAEKSWTGKD